MNYGDKHSEDSLVSRLGRLYGVERGLDCGPNIIMDRYWKIWDGGTLLEFKERVESVYGKEGKTPNKKYYGQYIAAVEFFEKMAKLAKKEEEIVKLPWKPGKEERCWYIITDPNCDNEESLIAVEDWWYGSFDEQIALKAGVVFRTREEAQKALPKVAAEMGVEYEL